MDGQFHKNVLDSLDAGNPKKRILGTEGCSSSLPHALRR